MTVIDAYIDQAEQLAAQTFRALESNQPPHAYRELSANANAGCEVSQVAAIMVRAMCVPDIRATGLE